MLTSGYQYFLTVDPISHSTRSSGQIISKINRASNAYYKIMDLVIYEILPVIIALVVTLAFIFSYSLTIGLVIFVIITVAIIINTAGFNIKNQFAKRKRIDSQDKADVINIESMQQATYIRSTFNTLNQIENIEKTNLVAFETDAVGWRMSAIVITSTQILGYLGLFILGASLLGKIDNILLTAILVSYMNLLSELYGIGRIVDSMITIYQDITDFFDFAKKFGTQTIPINNEDLIKNNE
jgi:ABC-type multidrug transport system fused ATPase/permease subunit